MHKTPAACGVRLAYCAFSSADVAATSAEITAADAHNGRRPSRYLACRLHPGHFADQRNWLPSSSLWLWWLVGPGLWAGVEAPWERPVGGAWARGHGFQSGRRSGRWVAGLRAGRTPGLEMSLWAVGGGVGTSRVLTGAVLACRRAGRLWHRQGPTQAGSASGVLQVGPGHLK